MSASAVSAAPPDADVRPGLDYRLLDGATVGDRELLYVYDAANARIEFESGAVANVTASRVEAVFDVAAVQLGGYVLTIGLDRRSGDDRTADRALLAHHVPRLQRLTQFKVDALI